MATKPTEDVSAQQVKVEEEFSADHFQLLRDRTKKPHDVTLGWEDTKLEEYPEGEYWVDVYEGPEGKGYVTRYAIVKDGVEYQMSVNVGPETYRTHDWVEVIKEK